MTDTPATVGRFAPSPTGPLHFGSVIAALGSWLDARAVNGTWRLRIDDLDMARTVPGMTDTIRRQLEALGLTWDGAIVHQGERHALYAEAIDQLQTTDAVYRCICTRRAVATTPLHGPLGAVYPGTCRRRPPPPERDAALRLKLRPGSHRIDDRLRGPWTIEHDQIGDVVVRRRTGEPAYHLATSIDDAEMGVTDVVRGADLQAASVIQNELGRRLALPAVRFGHLPVALAADGHSKLSKQTGATAVDTDNDPVTPLLEAWRFLGQTPPPARPATATEFLDWARARWAPDNVPV